MVEQKYVEIKNNTHFFEILNCILKKDSFDKANKENTRQFFLLSQYFSENYKSFNITEFEEVISHYPIVFTKNENNIFKLCLLHKIPILNFQNSLMKNLGKNSIFDYVNILLTQSNIYLKEFFKKIGNKKVIINSFLNNEFYSFSSEQFEYFENDPKGFWACDLKKLDEKIAKIGIIPIVEELKSFNIDKIDKNKLLFVKKHVENELLLCSDSQSEYIKELLNKSCIYFDNDFLLNIEKNEKYKKTLNELSLNLTYSNFMDNKLKYINVFQQCFLTRTKENKKIPDFLLNKINNSHIKILDCGMETNQSFVDFLIEKDDINLFKQLSYLIEGVNEQEKDKCLRAIFVFFNNSIKRNAEKITNYGCADNSIIEMNLKYIDFIIKNVSVEKFNSYYNNFLFAISQCINEQSLGKVFCYGLNQENYLAAKKNVFVFIDKLKLSKQIEQIPIMENESMVKNKI